MKTTEKLAEDVIKHQKEVSYDQIFAINQLVHDNKH